MSSLQWKWNRLRAMNPAEILYRVRQMSGGWLGRIGLGLGGEPAEPVGSSGLPWVDPLPVNFGESRAGYLARADRVLEGYFKVFALESAPLGFPPDWHRDPRTDTRAPLEFGKTLDYRNEAIVGDIKYLWEPNRHHALVFLAQAWHLSGEQRYLEGAATLLDSWIAQNPYPKGVNWSSSLELGLRLMNWAFAWHLLGGDRSAMFSLSSHANLRDRWLASIYQHQHFIVGHFSRYSSANNHLLGEYAGLFIGALTWPLWRESTYWREVARDGLESEAVLQNAEDGGNREQGIWYHHEVTDMLLLCAVVGKANSVLFSDRYWKQLESMLQFIASMMSVSGTIPMIGDSDDAVMVDFALSRDVYRSLLATGAVVFGRRDFKAKGCGFDDKTRWLLGDAASTEFGSLQADAAGLPVQRAFPQSGYYLLGDAFETADEVRLIADAGPLGYLSIAAHGHADALAFTLSVSGQEILVDPGTYAYHTQREWRNYFKGTSAHNTVRVDGVDQSVSAGNFMWLKHANAKCLEFHLGDNEEVWQAEHDGYLRLPDPVMHRRRVSFRKRERMIHVVDFLECRGHHKLEWHWHCSEHCKVSLDADAGVNRVSIEAPSGVTVVMEMPSATDAPELITGSESPPLGWISRAFDEKKPAPTIRWKQEINGSVNLDTFIRILGKGA
ncbi:alginate lyase family protein [Haliea sp. E17]|uniref:heparinase II/III family protein n=1 Tax=Haliea sp. E17 TaxID=3401576 RepID=UPI003AAD4AF0